MSTSAVPTALVRQSEGEQSAYRMTTPPRSESERFVSTVIAGGAVGMLGGFVYGVVAGARCSTCAPGTQVLYPEVYMIPGMAIGMVGGAVVYGVGRMAR